MGALHIEMATLKIIGNWLTGSEWADLLVSAGIYTVGTADTAESLLTASHLKRARYSHQITAASLRLLLMEAWVNRNPQHASLDFNCWIEQMRKISTNFEYWYAVLELQSILLTFVRSIRICDFQMFIPSLENIVPWMFSLDHVHYSRWMPIFIQNLNDLKLWHNDIYEQFLNGDFTMVKSLKKFSAIAEDQVHEQNNKLIQAEGGAIGILDSKDALIKWMIAGPELADIIYNYNENNSATEYESEYQHHREHTKSFDEKFRKNVTLLTDAFKEMGNVFEEKLMIIFQL